MSVLLPVSSALALAGLGSLVVAARIAAQRIAAVEHRLVRTDAALSYQTRLCRTLLAVHVAARASLLACPSCDLGLDEPCMCDMRRRSLATSLNEVDEFTASHAGSAEPDAP